jgi:DNA-binding MarR family transcriptional regulator
MAAHGGGSRPVSGTTELAASLRLVIGRLSRRLRQHAIGGLTVSQVSALASIERYGPLPLGRLAKVEGVAPPSLTRVVVRLEELGLVDRQADPADARSAVVQTTQAGRDALSTIRSERTAFLSHVLEQLDEEERRILAKAVVVLARIIDQSS